MYCRVSSPRLIIAVIDHRVSCCCEVDVIKSMSTKQRTSTSTTAACLTTEESMSRKTSVALNSLSIDCFSSHLCLHSGLYRHGRGAIRTLMCLLCTINSLYKLSVFHSVLSRLSRFLLQMTDSSNKSRTFKSGHLCLIGCLGPEISQTECLQ